MLILRPLKKIKYDFQTNDILAFCHSFDFFGM